MKKILILMGRYLPGFRDGGPIRTIVNLVDNLGDEYEFYIIAQDRDHLDLEKYPNVNNDCWTQVGKAKVWYTENRKYTFRLIRSLTKNVDIVYTCGFFDSYGIKLLILNRLNLLYGKTVIVAPMGVFSKGAFSKKSIKKRIFIFLCKLFDLFRNVKWSVSSMLEKNDLEKIVSTDLNCVIAEDIPRKSIDVILSKRSPKGFLKVVFISRICMHKNLHSVINILQRVNVQVNFAIYGPIEDLKYWVSCRDALSKLPENVVSQYCGECQPDRVSGVFRENDVFLFPTHGENYGHVIYESLSSGCIPIISDQTPWGFIEKFGGGFVVPIEDDSAFVLRVEEIANMSAEEKKILSTSAINIARQVFSESAKMTGYNELFK